MVRNEWFSDTSAVLSADDFYSPRHRLIFRALAGLFAQGMVLEPLAVPAIVKNFIFVVIDRRRVPLLKQIRQAYETLLDEHQGVVRADVSSAIEITDAQRNRLREEITKVTGKQVRCEFAVEGALLGGALVRVGSSVYDGSLRGQLEALRHRLLK